MVKIYKVERPDSTEAEVTRVHATCKGVNCPRAGSVVRCTAASCAEIAHLTCAGFSDDESAKEAASWYCSEACKQLRARSDSVSSERGVTDAEQPSENSEDLKRQNKSKVNSLHKKCLESEERARFWEAKAAKFEDEMRSLKEQFSQLVLQQKASTSRGALEEMRNVNQPIVTGEGLASSSSFLERVNKSQGNKHQDKEQQKRKDDYSSNLTQTSRHIGAASSQQFLPDSLSHASVLTQRNFSQDIHNRDPTNGHLSRPQYDESDSETESNKAPGYWQELSVRRKEINRLVEFRGEPTRWLLFERCYKKLKSRGKYDNFSLLMKLEEALKGEAAEFARQRLNSPFAKADDIMDALRQRFFDPNMAVSVALSTLEESQPVVEVDRLTIENLHSQIDNYVHLCDMLDSKAQVDLVPAGHRTTTKLPYSVQIKWLSYIRERNLLGTMRQLSQFLSWYLPTLPLRPTEIARYDPNRQKAPVAPVHLVDPSSLATRDPVPSNVIERRKAVKDKTPCWICGTAKYHYLYKCPEFRKLSYNAKQALLAKNKICTRCIASTQHSHSNCPRAKHLKCNKKDCKDPASHSAVMHSPDHDGEVKMAALHHLRGTGATLFKVVPVFVIDGRGNQVETTILLDPGAGASVVNKSFFQRLDIDGSKCDLELTWLQPGKTHSTSAAILHDLVIAPKHDPSRLITLKGMTAFDNVVLPFQQQNANELKKEFPFLQNADIPSFDKQRPQILLGLPHARWMVSLETLIDYSINLSPIAEKTPLGWAISYAETPKQSIFHVRKKAESDDESIDSKNELNELHELIKHYHSFEILSVLDPKKKYLCKDDHRALEVQENTMKRKGNRYEIGLYWKSDDSDLPDNYETALKRLENTEQRLRKLEMVQWANEHQEELRKLGFVREATPEDLNPPVPHKRINYVIGFVTFNKNKVPPKPRWVVDTACKHKGISLNSRLLKGPDNLIPLTQALFHFREREIAMVADVTKMYHQILIKPEDQQVQRFLWRDCRNDIEPKVYIFQSMLFGPTSAPSAANAVRIDHCNKSKKKYPEASRTGLDSMYMDDNFNSEDTVDEAVKVAKETIEMFKEISWDLVSFRSNNDLALAQLPHQNIDQELLIDLNSEKDIVTRKVLGLCWDPKKDVFKFKTAKNDELVTLTLEDNYHPTKREVLGFIMRIFDCLGLISHYHIRGRMILQTIWRRGLGWEQHIPDDIFDTWKLWIEKLAEIEQLEIPRHYGYISTKANNLSLHVFVDASTEVYAAVVYLRFEQDEIPHVALLMSKCRVAPVKHASIPRLELMAALIGSRLAKVTVEQHKRLKIPNITYWTDSKVVLDWLHAPHIRYTQFVAPRVSEIQETTSINDWRHVPTKENVADDGTKWNDIDFSSPKQRWIQGPDFLYENEELWPPNLYKFNPKAEILLAEVLDPDDDKDGDKYYAGIFKQIKSETRSNWTGYVTTVAWINRFISNSKAAIQGLPKEKSKILSVRELNAARNLILKRIQQVVFRKEYKYLSKGLSLPQTSKIYLLNVFLDDDNLLRARTRMWTEESISFDMKCPIILPNKHETVHSFLKNIHEKHFHIGAEAVAAESRATCWIIHVRKAVKRVIHKCLICIEKRKRHHIPPIAPLPECRTSPARAFENCGVDCAGPFTIYSGRSRHKREVYIVLFTCMTTRAIYLRKLDTLTADEMMLAIQDVWTRRGPIRNMYSDNGRNFVGASNIIKSEHHQKLANEKSLTWHFIPSATPNFGGAWERLIKDVKRAMAVVMNGKIIPEKVFETALLQIEDIMNSRPLTHLPVSPDDLTPLTPNYLVKLSPSYSFIDDDAKPDDESSRYYTRRARKISESLKNRWLKEYLTTITMTRKTHSGKGLNVGEYVIYTDPSKHPSEWKCGVVVNTYAGRDGFARVADIKTKSGEIIERKSVRRLAKIEIDDHSYNGKNIFNFAASADKSDNEIVNKSRENSNIKIIKMDRSIEIDYNKLMVFNILSNLKFIKKMELIERTDEYVSSIKNFISREDPADINNVKTVRILEVPNDLSIAETLYFLFNSAIDFTYVKFESIAKGSGIFIYIALKNKDNFDKILGKKTIKLSLKINHIAIPKSSKDPLTETGYEYAAFNYLNANNCTEKAIILRKADTDNKRNAIRKFDAHWMRLYKYYELIMTHTLPNEAFSSGEKEIIESAIHFVNVTSSNQARSHKIIELPTNSQGNEEEVDETKLKNIPKKEKSKGIQFFLKKPLRSSQRSPSEDSDDSIDSSTAFKRRKCV